MTRVMAIILAYEILGGLGSVAEVADSGFDQGTFMGVATAAAASRLYGLNEEQLANAISLAIVPAIPLKVTRRSELFQCGRGASPLRRPIQEFHHRHRTCPSRHDRPRTRPVSRGKHGVFGGRLQVLPMHEFPTYPGGQVHYRDLSHEDVPVRSTLTGSGLACFQDLGLRLPEEKRSSPLTLRVLLLRLVQNAHWTRQVLLGSPNSRVRRSQLAVLARRRPRRW